MSARIEIVHVDAEGLAPYVEGLRALERDITYPIGESDRFRIDHGSQYHPFFSGLGEAHFLVATKGSRVVGGICTLLKTATFGATSVVSAYACDFKIDPELRGGRLARKILWFGLIEILKPANAKYRTWRYLYGAAMRGAKGDMTRSARGLTPLRLTRPSAELAVFFTPVRALSELEVTGAPRAPEAWLDLSPTPRVDSCGAWSTRGEKDLRLLSTGAPWPLVHLPLGPRAWIPTHAEYLATASRALAAAGAEGPVCFALDRRLTKHLDWLAARGISADATCTIHAIRRSPVPRNGSFIHLATSEI
ncbi:MAG: GNAT family N-acetyltransferase [Deltaproteobacteria bacterium]|nr:GNAT family N-acetyltransferase [Deltaproteobacteria bacterium]